jgi:hypothetical protein
VSWRKQSGLIFRLPARKRRLEFSRVFTAFEN